MRPLDDVVVSCAVTGGIHTPSMSPHLPVTPDEIVSEAVAAAEAGASIVHLHVRDPETGEPTSDPSLFREVAERIHARTDVVVQPTTGGAPNQTVAERTRVVPELAPEMASCNVGSMNFGLYQMADGVEEFEYGWERDYLEGTREFIFPNSFADLERLLPTFDEHGTVPELECYDVGHLYNVAHLLDRGLVDPPLHVQFVTGIHGGIGADVENVAHMHRVAEKLLGDDYSFSVVGAGRMEFPLATQAATMGGHVRVGLEDNLYLGPGELAESNADLVEKAVRLVYEQTGREPATPGRVRTFLGLKGPEATDL